MSDKLHELYDLIQRLKDVGITAVIVGGAARDTYLGRVPKDWDLVILRKEGVIDVATAFSDATGYTVRELKGEDGETTESTGDASARGLAHVYESGLGGGLMVQLLEFDATTTAAYAGDPQAVVECHDCSLNKAWFEEHNGELKVRVAYDFPSPYTGNVNEFAGGVNGERRMYIQSKFPQYIHK